MIDVLTHGQAIHKGQPDLWPGNTGHDRRLETEDLIYGLKQKAEYRMCQGPASDTFVFADRASCIIVSEEVLGMEGMTINEKGISQHAEENLGNHSGIRILRICDRLCCCYDSDRA